MTTGVVKRVAANQADAHKAPVGRSSLVSAIVSQDCDVRAALRNATHARTHLIRGWLAAHQDLYTEYKSA